MAIYCPISITQKWPELCQSVDLYCERIDPAFDSELINAFSSLVYPIAAAAAFFYWQNSRSIGNHGAILTLIVLMAAIGVGSGMFHILATHWAMWADVTPILAFMVLYLWLIFSRFFNWSFGLIVVALAGFVGLTLFLHIGIPHATLWGGAMYLPALILILLLGVAMSERWPLAGRKLLEAAGVFAVAFFLHAIDMRFCAANPAGTHFLWHIMTGVVLFMLMRLLIRHAPRRAVPSWEDE